MRTLFRDMKNAFVVTFALGFSILSHSALLCTEVHQAVKIEPTPLSELLNELNTRPQEQYVRVNLRGSLPRAKFFALRWTLIQSGCRIDDRTEGGVDVKKKSEKIDFHLQITTTVHKFKLILESSGEEDLFQDEDVMWLRDLSSPPNVSSIYQ